MSNDIIEFEIKITKNMRINIPWQIQYKVDPDKKYLITMKKI